MRNISDHELKFCSFMLYLVTVRFVSCSHNIKCESITKYRWLENLPYSWVFNVHFNVVFKFKNYDISIFHSKTNS